MKSFLLILLMAFTLTLISTDSRANINPVKEQVVLPQWQVVQQISFARIDIVTFKVDNTVIKKPLVSGKWKWQTECGYFSYSTASSYGWAKIVAMKSYYLVDESSIDIYEHYPCADCGPEYCYTFKYWQP